MNEFHLKRGDRRPYLRATLQDADGVAINLATASGVTLRMRLPGSETLKVDEDATISDSANGVVEYQWASADVDTVGTYEAEFVVDWGSGVVQTVPNRGDQPILVHIHEPV